MRRWIRYGLIGLWVVQLALDLPTARSADDALSILLAWTLFVLLLALCIGLAGIVGDAIVRRLPRAD